MENTGNRNLESLRDQMEVFVINKFWFDIWEKILYIVLIEVKLNIIKFFNFQNDPCNTENSFLLISSIYSFFSNKRFLSYVVK